METPPGPTSRALAAGRGRGGPTPRGHTWVPWEPGRTPRRTPRGQHGPQTAPEAAPAQPQAREDGQHACGVQRPSTALLSSPGPACVVLSVTPARMIDMASACAGGAEVRGYTTGTQRGARRRHPPQGRLPTDRHDERKQMRIAPPLLRFPRLRSPSLPPSLPPPHQPRAAGPPR